MSEKKRGGRREGSGNIPLVDRLGISQLIRAALVNRTGMGDPEVDIVNQLADIYSNPAEATNNRLAAIKILLEYMYGKPKQVVSIEDNALTIQITKALE